jgi:ribose transport system ATP-binding protein
VTATEPRAAVALRVTDARKTFNGQRALKGVSLTVEAGEVHGLVGENGSGKSTFIKLLAGYHNPDSPTPIEICGRTAELPLRPGQARKLGVAFVHQELGLLGDLSVLENLLIDDFAVGKEWCIAWKEKREKSRRILAEFGIDFDPDTKASDLRPTDRALLAIARAVFQIRSGLLETASLSSAPGLLVLDEPTVYLPLQERQRLFDLVKSVRTFGVSTIFVAHDIDEVLTTTDRITVLRDGAVAGTVESKATLPSELIALILGSQLAKAPRVARARQEGPPLAVVNGLSGKGVGSISLDFARGDIVGLTGLPGSGFDDIPYLLFGASEARGGALSIGATRHELQTLTPQRAVKLGIAMIPADRSSLGAVGSLEVADNISLQILKQFRRPLGLSRKAIFDRASAAAKTYDVRPRDPSATYSNLSGGNQQKVLLAKWLLAKPSLLLIHEPTQGVDVGAREEIFSLLRKAADDGCAILIASTDHEQLAAVCNRVLITRAGAIAHDLSGPDCSKERITELSYGAEKSTAGQENVVG